MSSESCPCVSACHRCRATLAISQAAAAGSRCREAMSTASWEPIRSQTPSEPTTMRRSREVSARSDTSGLAITNGRMLKSPKDRVTQSPHRPVRSQTRGGPTSASPPPGGWRIGAGLGWMTPPCDKMRLRSSSRSGRWSLDKSTAHSEAPGNRMRPRTARESPTFAMYNRLRCKYTVTAVVPACWASKRWVRSMRVCVCR
mmetsp:Transcript_31056/g.89762  ORF Transcript_31056/g.89762 Transcript_31056/m.89762 type:complete len:200 (-) Transcript_31056:464-1063(-)